MTKAETYFLEQVVTSKRRAQSSRPERTYWPPPGELSVILGGKFRNRYSTPIISVQIPELDSLGDVLRGYVGGVIQIGNGSGYA
jgi:hypothetical protein